MKVGQRNIQICRLLLQEHSIAILAQETGGTVGRTIRLDCETGLLHVRTVWPKKEWAI
jgi:chemotaxis protein CheD